MPGPIRDDPFGLWERHPLACNLLVVIAFAIAVFGTMCR